MNPIEHLPQHHEAAPIYYGILTDLGQALLADAIANGTPLPLTHMAVGDGAGLPVTPQPEMTALVNEVHRAPLNQLFVDPTAANQIVAEMVMNETIGGFWIRELGLYDETGTLFAIANTPDSYKPLLEQGAGRALLTRMVLIVSDTAAVELIINPDTVMASRAYVEAKIAEHAASRDHPAAIEGAQGMIPLATQAMVDEGTDHASAVTPQTASATFAKLQHEHEIGDVLFLEQELDGKQPLDDTLTAIAGLVTTFDKLPYFTGPDAVALTTLTHFARTILDKTTGSDVLYTLGVSNFMRGLLFEPTATDARVTLEAAKDVHTHAAGDVGAAPISHTHTAAQGNQDIVAGGYGQVGTYVLAWNADGQSVFIGNAKPGSGLIPATAGERREDGHFLSGTYKCLGHVFGGGNSDDATTLWIRTDAASLFEQQLMLSELGWDNAEHDSATAIATFTDTGVSLPFTAFKDDIEAHGRWLFAMIRDGEFGPVAEYVPPTALEVAARDNPKTRQQALAYAIAQAQHWEMMGNPEQANAWRDYYQALYALDTTPGWPQVERWPITPSL